MQWTESRESFLSAVAALPSLFDAVDDWTVPALGEWRAAGLAGHILRGVRTPVRYLAEPEPTAGPLRDAAAYYLAYLRWREEDPDAADAAVARRGMEEVSGLDPHQLTRELHEAEAAVKAALQGITGDRKITTPFGVMRVVDYLRTRTLEVTVHGLDLARAAGIDWHPPELAVADTLRLLAELARELGRGESLVLLLTGRTVPADAVLPVLR